MGKNTFRGIIVAAILLVSGQAGALASLTGSPPVARFVPDTDTFPQNFTIAEDRDSVIYVGNAEGVLSFDGERWRLISLPGGDVRVRALVYDGHRRIYVGGLGVFGYLQRNAAGRQVFHDLTPLFRKQLGGSDFGDIWDIVICRQGVLFAALRHLFLYDPATGRTQLWRADTRLGAVSGDNNGGVLVQFRGVGLKRLHNGHWETVAGGAASRAPIYRMLPMPRGGLLLFAADGHWRVYRDGRIEDFAVPEGFPAASHFAGGCVLPDGTLALVSDAGSVYFLSADRRRVHSVHLDNGYLSRIIRANGGGLLVVDDKAVFHIDWPAQWTALGNGSGLSGSMHGLVEWAGQWYALTTAGVFKTAAGATEGPTVFKPAQWTNIEAWDLLPIDDTNALLASPYAISEIHAGRLRTVARLYPELLVRSTHDPDIVYAGTETGVAVLALSGGRWRLKLNYGNLPARATNSIVEAAPHRLWVGSERGGLELLELNKDDTRVANVRRYTAADGLVYGDRDRGESVARLPGGVIVVSTAAGEFRWTGSRFVRDGLGGLDAVRHGERVTVTAAPDGDLWAWSWNHLYHRVGGRWREAEIARLRDGAIENLTFDRTGAALLSVGDMILRYHPVARKTVTGRPPRVLLRSVEQIRPDGTRRALPLTGAGAKLPQGGFGLEFKFALPDYAAHDAVRYQGRLLNFESHFSNWSEASHYTYSHLPAGDYRFEVRGRDSAGRITEAAPFTFTIVPPWYDRSAARFVWLLLLIALVALATSFAIRLRTRRLAAKAGRLERMVADHTRDLEEANRKLRAMAHLDGLTGIPNRRRLDDYMEQVWAQCCEHDQPLAILLIDVDHFKVYNDRHGHLAGDDVLKRLVATLTSCLRRAADLLARYGGEEFIVVLPGADAAVAQDVAENMRTAVEAAQFGITISTGTASCEPCGDRCVRDLVKAADKALYQAKTLGRNRTASIAVS